MTSQTGSPTEDPVMQTWDVDNVPVVKKMKYPPPGKSDKILENLHTRRHDGELCDIKLKLSQTKTVHAHKSLLASCSLYFESMFMGAFMEATSEIIDLSHITRREELMENVIDTFYGRQFEINEDNVSDVINIATMFMIEDLKAECNTVLLGLASVHNAVQMLQLSLNFELEDLKSKVLPIIQARFHDYIIFQDDLMDLSFDGFRLLVNNINTEFISRRVEYIQFILRWFLVCETDERAQIIVKAMENIKFKIRKDTYTAVEEQLEDVLGHLDDANSDLSDEMKSKLNAILPSLKPRGYIKNSSPVPDTGLPLDDSSNKTNDLATTGQNMDTDTDFDEEPKREAYNTFGAERPEYGPPTKAKGFTEEEKKAWDKAHKEMAERDQHRIWAEKWPLDPLNKLGTRDNPERPKHIKREQPYDVYKSRKFPVKSERELKEKAELVDAVIVLAPTNAYRKYMEAKDIAGVNAADDVLDVCAYIPSKHAWYKITSMPASSIETKFSQPDRSTTYRERHRQRRRDDSDSDGSDNEHGDDSDGFHLEDMMNMYDPEMMMMMMGGLSGSRRRRFMEEAARGRVPPSMLRRMMDMDEDDLYRFEMMRGRARMPHRIRDMLDMRSMVQFHREKIPSLSDPKWNCVYLKHRLYFNHQDIKESVFCFDIIYQGWQKLDITYSRESNTRHDDIIDGLDLIVIDQTLYAVLRVAAFDSRRRYGYPRRTKEEKIEESKIQEVNVKHAVFKLIGEQDAVKWEKVIESSGNPEYIPVDKEYRIDPEKEHHVHPMMEHFGFGNNIRQPDALKTLLYAEDEQKLFVFSLVRKHYNNNEEITGYVITNTDILYLDLKQVGHIIHSPDKQMFRRTLIPLYSDGLVTFLNDDLSQKGLLDLGVPSGQWFNARGFMGYEEPEKRSEFLEAMAMYPRCPSILVGLGDGKSLYILRGKGNDISETVEMYATMCYQTRESKLTTLHHPAPPFRCFTMAMDAKMNKNTIKTLGLPMKYSHTD